MMTEKKVTDGDRANTPEGALKEALPGHERPSEKRSWMSMDFN